MKVYHEDKTQDSGMPAGSNEEARPHTEEKGQIVDVSAAYTPEEEKRVLRKIDCTILPMVNKPNYLLHTFSRTCR